MVSALQTNLKQPVSRLILISFIALLFFIAIAFLIHLESIISFDQRILLEISKVDHPVMTNIMLFFSAIGSPVAVIILSLLILVFLFFVLKHRAELVLFASVTIASAVFNQLLKIIFQRVRPDVQRFVEETGYSFPSGHSMAAFTLYGMLAFLLWRHIPSKPGRILLLIFSSIMILSIGFSRLYLGVHYPSDVIGAYLFSGFLVGSSIWFFQRLSNV